MRLSGRGAHRPHTAGRKPLSSRARMASTILCYGDSNTWGFVPGSEGERFSWEERWPGVLQGELGADYRVIEEGLSGRTTVLDNPLEPYRNGREYLLPCLQSHQPLDLVVIFLGTNDLGDRYSLPPLDIARGAAQLALLALRSETGPGLRGTRRAALLTAENRRYEQHLRYLLGRRHKGRRSPPLLPNRRRRGGRSVARSFPGHRLRRR